MEMKTNMAMLAKSTRMLSVFFNDVVFVCHVVSFVNFLRLAAGKVGLVCCISVNCCYFCGVIMCGYENESTGFFIGIFK